MKLIELTGQDKVLRRNVLISIFVKVDDEDYEWLKQYKWNLNQRSHYKYAVTTIPDETGKQKVIKMHRLVMKVKDSKLFVDHINNDGLDNQKHNLRVCNVSQNAMNKHRHKNKYKGVHTSNRKMKNGTITVRYVATCTKGKKHKTKWRKTEKEAALAYNEMALEMFGEYAQINVIDDNGEAEYLNSIREKKTVTN